MKTKIQIQTCARISLCINVMDFFLYYVLYLFQYLVKMLQYSPSPRAALVTAESARELPPTYLTWERLVPPVLKSWSLRNSPTYRSLRAASYHCNETSRTTSLIPSRTILNHLIIKQFRECLFLEKYGVFGLLFGR